MRPSGVGKTDVPKLHVTEERVERDSFAARVKGYAGFKIHVLENTAASRKT